MGIVYWAVFAVLVIGVGLAVFAAWWPKWRLSYQEQVAHELHTRGIDLDCYAIHPCQSSAEREARQQAWQALFASLEAEVHCGQQSYRWIKAIQVIGESIGCSSQFTEHSQNQNFPFHTGIGSERPVRGSSINQTDDSPALK